MGLQFAIIHKVLTLIGDHVTLLTNSGSLNFDAA